MITIIACVGNNGVIGKDGSLPWYLPADLTHFKETTLGSTVVMGSKTFQSIIDRNGQPLKGRQNVVLTRKSPPEKRYSDVEYTTLSNLLYSISEEDDLFVIGGADIYNQFLPLADELILTRVNETFVGDTYFPEIGLDWIPISVEEGSLDSKNMLEYYFIKYKRAKS